MGRRGPAGISLSTTLALGGAQSVGVPRWWPLCQVRGKQQRSGCELKGQSATFCLQKMVNSFKKWENIPMLIVNH